MSIRDAVLRYRAASLLILLLSAATVAVAAPIPIIVCIQFNTGGAFQLAYASTYYASDFPYIAPQVKFLGMPEKSATPRGAALALAANGSNCDIYLGPISSSAAQAVNALINSMWMAGGVTANELSDRVNYPLFGRAAPTADVNQGAIASLMASMEWKTISVLCSDNSYGQAVTAGISKQLRAVGGTILAPSCVDSSALYAVVSDKVQTAINSASRVIFVAAGAGEAALVNGVKALNALDPSRRMIVVFSETACTGSDVSWRSIPGAYCATFNPDPVAFGAFYASFLKRNTVPEKAQIAALGLTYNPTAANSISGYSALGVDAARLCLQAMSNYVGIYGAKPPDAVTAVGWLRNTTLYSGLVGPLAIPNGDRTSPTPMKILNMDGNGTAWTIANYTVQGNLSLASLVYAQGRWVPITTLPPAVDPAPPTVAAQPLWVIGLVVGVLLLVALPVAYVARQRQLLAVRPLNSAAPFAVLFVGVKNVDDVNDAGESNASAALATVAACVRAAVQDTGCYEARRVDESTVMIVAKTADRALACAAEIMDTINKVQWPQVMKHDTESEAGRAKPLPGGSNNRKSDTRSTHSRQRTHNSDSESVDSRTKSRRGTVGTDRRIPVLHIGVHFGFGMIDNNTADNTVSYVGAVVSRAAKVADAAVAEQILTSKEVQEAAEDNAAAVDAIGQFSRVDAWESFAPDTVMFSPKGLTADKVNTIKALASRTAARAAAHHKSGGSAASAPGAISAALQRADAGFSQRRIGVAVVRVPWLLTAFNDSAHLSKISRMMDEIHAICVSHRGEVHAVIDDVVVITVNAGAVAAQAVPRAAMIALECVKYLGTFDIVATAGVSGGPALVGKQGGGAAVAVGPVVSAARVAEMVGRANCIAVAATDTAYDDLAARLHLATIDVMPMGNIARNPNELQELSRVLAVVGERDATSGEWLYSMGMANAGLGVNEEAWANVMNGAAPPIAAISAPPTAAEASSLISAPGDAQWTELLNSSRANLASAMYILSGAAAAEDEHVNWRSAIAQHTLSKIQASGALRI